MNRILHIDIEQSVIDSVIYNLLYFPLGMAIWYVVRFNKLEAGNILQLILIQLVSALALNLIWIFLAYNLSTSIDRNPDFIQFQKAILPSRFLIGLLYYVIMMLVHYLLIYYQNFREKIEKEAAVYALLKEAELNALKLQINPHFIFNCLNSVNSLIMTNPNIAQEMIVKLSDFLRLTLSGNTRHTVTMYEELNFSKLYLEIEKIRFENKLLFSIDMDKKFNNYQVPHMLFQPLLENAIKHGVQQSTKPVRISLNVTGKDQGLEIIIKNNKEGNSVITGPKIGLKNIKERLSLLYNRSDLISTEVSEYEYVVKIQLPFEHLQKNA
jgi:two-component system, LytTR family, sensor kinase